MRTGRRAGLLLAACALACGPTETRAPGSEAFVPADAEWKRADSLYSVGAFEEARGIWLTALEKARRDGDSATSALLLTSLGLAARQLGAYPESRALGEEALDLKLRLGLRPELFRSYNALGLLAWNEGRLEEAARMFSQASRAAAVVGDSLGVAKAAHNMALVHNDRGEPGLARAGFEHLRDLSRSLGDTLSWGRALINLAMLDIRNGDPLPAIASLEDARRLARAVEDPEAEENALGQLATAYELLGEPQRAFATLDSALILAERHGLQRQAAEDVKLLGDLHAAAGDHRGALDHYGRARTLADDLGLVEEMGNLLRSEAESFILLGHGDTALARAEQAERVHHDAGYREAELQDLILLARISADRGDTRSAARIMEGALGIAGDLGSSLARARVALGSARIWDGSGDPEAVLRALESAADELARLGDGERWEPDALRARAYARLDRLDAAEAAGHRSMEMVERVRAAYGATALRTSFASAHADVYGDLVLVLLRQGRVSEAFEVADAARGRALMDHLSTARSELATEAGAAEQLLRATDLLRRIDDLMERLQTLEGRPARDRSPEVTAFGDSLQVRLGQARSEYEALISRVALVPDAALLGSPTARLGEIQESLRPGEVLLEYMVFEDRVDAFAVSPAEVIHVSRPASVDALAAQVRLAIDLGARAREGTAGEPILQALYETLLGPIAQEGSLDRATRLIVIPHGPLVYLPFAALMDGTGAPLATRFSLLFLPSASALPVLRAPPPPHAAPRTTASLVLAPLPDALPRTLSEAADVGAALGLGDGRILVGNEATEGVLRRGLASSRIVHVATHGVMNPLNPMFTRLDLAPGEAGETKDDGRLEVREILALEVAAGLVYLSGCETGRGQGWATGFEKSEDFATLAQAFLYAGADNVVATLWRVSDPAAAAFAARFYEALADHDPVDALATAQRAMFSDPRFRAPYFWAAYQITGSGSL